MRANTPKRAKRNRDCVEWRRALIQRVGVCEICGCDPSRWSPMKLGRPWSDWILAVHELSRGPHRVKALDKAFAVLVVCRECHDELGSKALWPEARQLAALKRSRPTDMDLAAYNALVGLGTNRITEAEVDSFKRGM
jgi:hypothetical protein